MDFFEEKFRMGLLELKWFRDMGWGGVFEFFKFEVQLVGYCQLVSFFVFLRFYVYFFGFQVFISLEVSGRVLFFFIYSLQVDRLRLGRRGDILGYISVIQSSGCSGSVYVQVFRGIEIGERSLGIQGRVSEFFWSCLYLVWVRLRGLGLQFFV